MSPSDEDDDEALDETDGADEADDADDADDANDADHADGTDDADDESGADEVDDPIYGHAGLAPKRAGDAGGKKGPGVARARPWQGTRPGSAAMRLGSETELLTVLVYDVPCDKTRRKVGERCKDYGLTRLQWSVFEGPMTRNRREELWSVLAALLAEAPGGGKLAAFPIGTREAGFASREIVKGRPLTAREEAARQERLRAGGDDD